MNLKDPEIQKRALTYCRELKETYKTLSDRLQRKFLDYWQLYRLFQQRTGEPWQSNLFIPKAFEIVERVVPSVIAHDPKFILVPRYNDAVEYLIPIRNFLYYAWDINRCREKLESAVKDAGIYGTGILKVVWKQHITKEKEIEEEIVLDEEGNPIADEMGLPKTETREYEYDMVRTELPDVERIDIFNFLTDPFVEDLDEADGCIHLRDNVPIEELDKDMYFNLDELHSRMRSALDDVDEIRTKRNDVANSSETKYYSFDNFRVNIAEYWCRFSPTGEAEDLDEYVITIANDNTIIRLEKSPCPTRPFVKIVRTKVPGEFYGIGLIEPIEDLSIELTSLRRGRQDYLNMLLSPQWIVQADANIDPRQLIHRPNNIIFTDNMNGIQQIPIAGTPAASYNEEAQILRDIQTVSNVVDVTDTGGSFGFNNTATGVKERVRQQSLASNSFLKHVEIALAKIGEKFLALSSKYLDDKIEVRRFNDPGKFQNPEDLNGKEVFDSVTPENFKKAYEGIDVKIEAGSTVEDTYADKSNRAVAMSNTAMQFAQAGLPIDLREVYRDVMTHNFMAQNPDKYIKEQQPEMNMDLGGGPQGPPPNLQMQPTLPSQ